MRQRLLVIGNGMAAMQLVESLLQRAPQRYAITVIGREPHGNYNRVLLSPVLAGEMHFSETLIHPPSWYQQHGVTLLAGETVRQVDLAARTVLTDQRQLGWDRLVFATGSQPRLPAITGIDRPQVSGFRSINDVERLLAGQGPVAVLGGGFLGIEAAAALRAQGREVTLIHHKGWLLDRQLDARAGELLLTALRGRGIRCLLNSGLQAITATGVTLADGTDYAAGQVVIAIGVDPAVAVARAAGLPCQRGILVDRQLRSAA